MTAEKKFARLAAPCGDAVELANGVRLQPGTKLYLMYQNLLGTAEKDEITTERDIRDMHFQLQQSISMFGSTCDTSRRLSETWTLYLDRLTSINRDVSINELDMSSVVLGDFDSVEGFMTLWNQIPIRDLEGNVNVRIFKKDIVPSVEDIQNADGGKWITRTPSAERSTLWLNMALLAISNESLRGVMINGCVMISNSVTQAKADSLQLWVSGRSPGTEQHTSILSEELQSGCKRPFHLHFTYQINTPQASQQFVLKKFNASSEPSKRGSEYGGSNGIPSLMSAPSTPGGSYQHNPYGGLEHAMANSTGVAVYPKAPGGYGGWQSQQGPNSATSNFNYQSADYAPLQRNNSANWSDVGRRDASAPQSPPHDIKGPQVQGVLRQVTANLLGYNKNQLQYPRQPPSWPHDQDPSELQSIPDYTTTGSVPERKKKRNKPDKYQRERIRKKKAKQAALEQAMLEMAGVKCCECELQLSAVKCSECPESRMQFCNDCFTLIHKVGKRQSHTQYIVFENPGEPPSGGSLVNQPSDELIRTYNPSSDSETNNTGADQSASTPPSDKTDEPLTFLRYFDIHQDALVNYIEESLDSFNELKGFSEPDVVRVLDEFFADKTFSALKRGRATRELLTWIKAE